MSARVLPDVAHPDFAQFWQGCSEGRLLVPRCDNGHLVWPPRPACPTCFAFVTDWTEVSGTGRLYSWTVVHRTRLPWYSERTPYLVGIVTLDLDQPVRMVGRCEIPLDRVCEGTSMVVEFEDAGREVRIPFWRPAPEGVTVDDG